LIKMAIKALYLQLEFNQQARVKEARSPRNKCLPVFRTIQEIAPASLEDNTGNSA